MEKAITRVSGTPIIESLAGALILAVGMGFGRFSFTGMYPLMVKESVITVAGGSLAASANYAGYLIGAILMSRIDHRHAARLCQFAMIGTIASLAALSLHFGTPFAIAVRFVAGVVSAVSMVAASIWLLNIVGYHHGSPILYAGVGAGIIASAEIIAAGNMSGFNSSALWALLAAVALVLCAFAWPRLGRDVTDSETDEIAGDNLDADAGVSQPLPPGAWTLIAICGLAGFGYIVTATFLPLLVKNVLSDMNPVHVWAAFGLAAAPSCFLWHWLHRKLGSRFALALNLVAQAAGVILPACSTTAPAFLASAVIVGGTFMGTVTIAMPAAKRVASSVKFNVTATMTAAYGAGQIVGPLVSTTLFTRTHSFNQPLAAATAALIVAAIACLR